MNIAFALLFLALVANSAAAIMRIPMHKMESPDSRFHPRGYLVSALERVLSPWDRCGYGYSVRNRWSTKRYQRGNLRGRRCFALGNSLDGLFFDTTPCNGVTFMLLSFAACWECPWKVCAYSQCFYQWLPEYPVLRRDICRNSGPEIPGHLRHWKQ